jgi:hypothetical protein
MDYKSFLTPSELKEVEEATRHAESSTSGEIRVLIVQRAYLTFLERRELLKYDSSEPTRTAQREQKRNPALAADLRRFWNSTVFG